MTRFVAFLRGINVGGRSVKKDLLKGIFEGLGFEQVVTYKQSGNVIFETEETDPNVARKRIETALRQELGYDVAVLIRTFADLRIVAKVEPKVRDKDVLTFLVTLLPTPVHEFPLPLPLKIPKSTAQVLSRSEAEVFSVTYGGGDSALPNPFLESKLGVKTTTRNMNVIRELVERFGQSQ